MNIKRKRKNVLAIVPVATALVFIAGAFFVFFSSKEADAHLNGFRAGNIMSDYVMSNKNSMNEAQIQAFLKSKNPCNDTDYLKYQRNSAQGYSYNWRDGHFVCMADESFNGKSAARIIWEVAQQYSINPQVLIVLLQKEQGLVTDTWPNQRQYQTATGFGCPDTAPCDAQYYGLENQLRQAAKLFRTVLDGGWSNYPAYSTVYVRYNPDANCGGTNVYIENRATSALYRYTPYQPNAATLAVPVGVTAHCGAYGNKNFYHYFTEWFGSTQTLPKSDYLPEGDYYISSVIDPSKAIGFTSDNALRLTTKSSDFSRLRLVRNGDHYLISNTKTGKLVDVINANAYMGATMQQWEQNGSDAQKWLVQNNGDGTFSLSSKLSYDLLLDLPYASTANNLALQLYNRNNTPAQKFYIVPATQPIENNKIYNASSALNQAMALDVYGAGKTSGTKVQLWSDNFSDAQRWLFSYDSNTGYYVIKNPNSNKVLDVYGGGTAAGTDVQIWENNGTCAQSWRINKRTNRSYEIISSCSNKLLDVAGGISSNGTKVQIWENNGTGAQQWFLNENFGQLIADGVYTVKSKIDQNKVLDVYGGGKASGTKVQIWENNGTGAQQWDVRYNTNSQTYTITNTGSDKVLDVYGGGKASGTKVQIWENNGTGAQQWVVKKYEDGSLELVSAGSGLALDISGGQMQNGTSVQVWIRNSSLAQKWSFVK